MHMNRAFHWRTGGFCRRIDRSRGFVRGIGGAAIVLLCWSSGASAALLVQATEPPRYALQVPPDEPEIRAFFNGPLAPLPSGAVRVAGSMSGLHAGEVVLADNVVIFRNQSGAFFPGEVVHVDYRNDIRNVGGESLTGGYYFAFTAASAAATVAWSPRVGYESASVPYFIHGGDLDGDGDPDIAAPNEGTGDVSIFLNVGGTGSFPQHQEYGVGERPSSIFGEDFDNDGDQDLATADINSGTVSVLLNNGDGSFAPRTVYAAGNQCRQIHGGDFDGDNDVDLCATAFGADRVFLYYNAGNGTFAPGVPFSAVSDGPFAIRTGDLNGDGHIDIAVACQNADSLSVLSNNGLGGFTRTGTYRIANGPWCLNGNDLDGDGDFDLASVASFADEIVTLVNDGAGGYPNRFVAATEGFPLGVFVADLDGDGDIDATSSNYSGASVGVYLNPGNGQIALQTNLATALSGSYTWAHDLDGDGDLDLSVVDEEADSLFVFVNGLHASEVAERGERRATITPSLRILPNPARAGDGAGLAVDHVAGAASIDLIRIDGRRLRRLWSGELDGRPRVVRWDGRDAQGRPLAAGGYRVVLDAGDLRLAGSIVIAP